VTMVQVAHRRSPDVRCMVKRRTLHATPVIAYIALGANLGNAVRTVQQAISQLGGMAHTQLVASSSLYRSAPVDSSGPDYINAVAQVLTHLTAPQLLQQLQLQERMAGRQRPYANAPRTLDLDILLYGSASIQSPALTVPHPRMAQRAFVLQPLADIAPQLVCDQALHAVSGQSIYRL
jgi:2-amino-4-hydroxy-6-hydroxymethyldihydropteridine diphosphokinase